LRLEYEQFAWPLFVYWRKLLDNKKENHVYLNITKNRVREWRPDIKICQYNNITFSYNVDVRIHVVEFFYSPFILCRFSIKNNLFCSLYIQHVDFENHGDKSSRNALTSIFNRCFKHYIKRFTIQDIWLWHGLLIIIGMV